VKGVDGGGPRRCARFAETFRKADEDVMVRNWAALGFTMAALGAFAACDGADRDAQPTRGVQDAPAGSVPVPGAASPGSAPDPHPAATRPDAAYPGAVEPHPAPVDTLRQPGMQNAPGAAGAARP
jgi:hypothetical protein